MQGGQDQQQERIYLTTDGLTSPSTKRAYHLSFNHFIKTTVKNDNLRALLDTKQNVIESKIIDHITYLSEVQHLSYVSIQTHFSGILRFFSMISILTPRKYDVSYLKILYLKMLQEIAIGLIQLLRYSKS